MQPFSGCLVLIRPTGPPMADPTVCLKWHMGQGASLLSNHFLQLLRALHLPASPSHKKCLTGSSKQS